MSRNNQKLIDNLFRIRGILQTCDIADVNEEGIHLESWGEVVPWSRVRAAKKLLSQSGYDLAGFELMDIPEPHTFCFADRDTKEYFDIIFEDEKATFGYIRWADGSGLTEFPADSIEEAIKKYNWIIPEQQSKKEEPKEAENPEFSPEEYEKYKCCTAEEEKKFQEIRKRSSAESATNLKILLELIQNNPELPVIPIVNQEICDAVDFLCDFTVCKLGKSYIQEYCYYAMGDDVETLMYTEEERKKISIDATKKGVHVEWNKAIFVPVSGLHE